MTRNIIITITAGFVVTFMVAALGVHALLGEYALQTMRKDVQAALENGDYAAALGHLRDLEGYVDTDTEIEGERARATALLVAAANYEKAKIAADSGEWFDVRALLRDSDAVHNESFIYYNEAVTLLAFAEKRIVALEDSNANEIAGLEKNTAKEKKRSTSLQSKLQTTIKEKNETTNVLDSTKQMLEKSNRKITETEAEIERKKQLLLEEQQKVAALAEQAAREKLEKFLNEINVYVASLRDGASYIVLAEGEIKQKKDVSALLYISQAKTLFDDVYGKTVGLRDRSEDSKKEWTERVISASKEFLATVKNLRNSVIVIEDQDGEEFKTFSKNAENARNRADALVLEVQTFIDQNKK